jgi:hypothetical protein
MKTYKCDNCNKIFKQKIDYTRHLLRKYPCKKSEKFAEFGENLPIIANKVINDIPDNVCQYCHKTYSRKYEVKRHHRICKVKKTMEEEEKMNDLIKLNDKNTQILEHQQTQIDNLEKNMSTALVNKSSNITTQNNTKNTNSHNNINTTNNILLSFKDTDTSHMKIKDWEKIMMRCCMSVPACVQKLHFDPMKPENKNIYKSNLKDKYLKYYEDDKWKIVNQEQKIDTIYNNYSGLLEEIADKWEEDEVKHSTRAVRILRRFLEKQDEPNVYNNILKELIMIFYNNR